MTHDIKCAGHCDHVTLVWHAAKRLERLMWIVVVLVLGVFAKVMAPALSDRLREPIPMAHAGEILAPDRVERGANER